ncbi:MAG: class I SAM-dependent methyltransferase [Oscillatoriales cyanobacterium SM2_1_8]|nr:class I SAM-dependent methyltransferase [Oscillatoriales cyanobacterium SM2_1_8]
MWDQRYAVPDYIYGKEPNDFLVAQAHRLQGQVLSLAEGEGRNAVFLATLGLSVHGVDSSAVGLAKAEALARDRGVVIRTEVADLAEFVPAPETYDGVVSIFAHLPKAIRDRLYPLVEKCLKPGGLLLLEAYSEDQQTRSTGGPKDVDRLMSPAKLLQAFPHLEPLHLWTGDREVWEGTYHRGASAVVQFIARKPGEGEPEGFWLPLPSA